MTDFEDGLRRLKVEYDIFFNGHRKRPPDDLRGRVERMSKRLSEASGMSFVQRFRYNTIVARYHVMRDLWRRTMQQREIGTALAERPAAPEAAGQETQREPEIKVLISDPGRDQAKIRELYDTILQMRERQATATPNISYQQFARYISDQTQKIQGKFGCASVQFAVSIEQDAIRFTARAAESG